LHHIVKRSNAEINAENHKIARRAAKYAWKKAQSAFYDKLKNKIVNSDNPKKYYWKFVRAICGTKLQNSVPPLLVQNMLIEHDIDKANAFNEFFAEQATLDLLLESTIDALEQEVSSGNLLEIVTLPKEVFKVISSLNTGKATGPDGVGNIVLRSCA